MWRKLFGALISMGRYNRGWRELFKALILVERYYIGGEIWRELFGALIIGEGSREDCSKQLY